MNDNEFLIELIAKLQQVKSKKQINTDIRQLEKAINMLRLTGTLAKGNTKREINQYVKELGDKLSYVKLKGKLDEKGLKREIDTSLHNMTFKEVDALNVDGNKARLKLQKAVADMKAYAEKTPISVNVSLKKEKLGNDLTSFLNRNSKIKESRVLLEESERIRELIDSVNDKGTLKNATDAFSLFKSEVTACGFATKSTTDKIKGMLSRVTKIGSFFGLASLAVNQFRQSLSALKSNNTILTEISKTSEMTKKQLEELGNEAFKVASKYGQLSGSYLLGVQEMSRAGYENADSMAELSTKVQGAGDMTAKLANQYIIAIDKAYKLNGSIGALTATLDGANNITNNNAVNMTELAEGMSIVGSQAASLGVAANETTAVLGTMIATTQQSGSEMARAFRAILLNLQQVTDEEEGIDAEGLTKYEDACKALNVSLKETKNGITSLRDPMEVIKDLAAEYSKLDSSDIRRTNLLSSVGGKLRANALNSLLENYDMYSKMLDEYADGLGSMNKEAEKTAKSWQGRLNSLQNSFDSFVNTLTNKEAILGGISFFDRLIQGAEGLTNAVGEIPVLLTAINSALAISNKDYGIKQIWNKDKRKIDIEGNFLGIDFTAIKNMKKHFSEAEEVIAKWNKELKAGKADLDTFENSLVQNNAQFKEYLSTCSKDAPASLEGYKAHLKAAGVNTDTLRWKTILLNSAITMLGGLAIQSVITGFYELSQVSSKVAESAKELGSSFNDAKFEIEDYKSKIEELHKTINDGSSSIEDVTNARKTLMSVQNELINKFGTEKSVIDDVTKAIDGQTEALDRLTYSKWQETKNEFNNGDFWNDAANFFQGTNNIERMLNEYEDNTLYFQWVDFADINKLTDEMVAELENIGIDIRVSTDNLQDVRYFDSLTESISDTNGASLYFSGNAEEIYNKLLALQNLIGNDDSFDKLYDKVESTANSYKDLIDNYKEFYNQYILYEKILTENSDYADAFKDITDAYEEYKDAYASGDDSKIEVATEKYASILTTAIDNAIENGDLDVADYFENMYPTLKSTVEGWQFNVAFDANTDDLQTTVQSVLDELKDENGRSLTAEEILGLGAENKQYQALISIAHSYNMTLEEMIELLKERKLVSTMDYQRLVSLFGQENVNKLKEEDLEIAFTIKNVGNITFDQLQAEIQKIKDMAVKDTPTFTDTISQVQSLSTGLEKLGKIYTDVKNKETFDWSSILNNEEFANTFSSMGSTYDNFIKTVSNAPDDIEACQEAFDKLATSYIYNKKDANGNNVMDNLTESTKDATVAMLEQMGVVNALEVVEAELAKKEEILEVQRRYASEHATELTDATYNQANAYITEANCSEIAKKYLAQLYLQKNLYNGSEISTEEDCENLIQLAKTAGYTDIVLTKLRKLKQMFVDNPIMSNVVREDINRAIKNIFSEAQADIESIDFDLEFDGSEAEKSASSAAKSFTDLLDKELAVLDAKMEAGYIDFKDYIEARRDLIEDYYRQGKLAADQYYSYLEKHYKQELTYKDKVINAVTRRIDKEIDKFEKQKDDIESYYKVQIDELEKEKTLLEGKNREKEKEFDLQKKLYDLEKARNQRTDLIYTEEKGLIYNPNDQAIRDAQQEVENAEFELKISEIEKKITNLEEARDRETDAIDDMIDKLEEYKDKWNDITSAYEESQEDLIAEQMLGRDWEKDILDTRLDTLNKFKDDYIAIQQAMVDAAYEAAKAMANAENVKIGDSSKGKLSDKDNGTHGWEVIDEKTASRIGTPFSSEQQAKDYAKKLNEQKAKENGMTLAQFNNSDIPGYYVKKYHTGLKQGLVDKHSFDDDFKLVQEVGLGDKEVPAILKEGEAVATPEQISNIADGLRETDDTDDSIWTTLADGTKVRPLQPGDRMYDLMQKFDAFFNNNAKNIEKIVPSSYYEHQKQMENMANQLIRNSSIVNNRNVQPNIHQEFHITMPNVTNSTSAETLMRDLQSLNTKKFQVDWK